MSHSPSRPFRSIRWFLLMLIEGNQWWEIGPAPEKQLGMALERPCAWKTAKSIMSMMGNCLKYGQFAKVDHFFFRFLASMDKVSGCLWGDFFGITGDRRTDMCLGGLGPVHRSWIGNPGVTFAKMVRIISQKWAQDCPYFGRCFRPSIQTSPSSRTFFSLSMAEHLIPPGLVLPHLIQS